MKLIWLIILIIIVAIGVSPSLGTDSKTRPSHPTIPPILKRIRYIRVDYVNWRNMSDQGTLEYEGIVKWSSRSQCWGIFIDSGSFADNMIEKKNYRFLDANKNILPTQNFSVSTEILAEGDCGYVIIKEKSSM